MSPLWHVIADASSLPPCVPVFFCFSVRLGFRRPGQVPCFGQDPNICLQGPRIVPGLSCRCRRFLRHYITTLQTDLSCTFLPCLFIITTKSHRLSIHLYKVS